MISMTVNAHEVKVGDRLTDGRKVEAVSREMGKVRLMIAGRGSLVRPLAQIGIRRESY